MVCPDTWVSKVGGEKVTHSFSDKWSECVPREPNFGIFAKNFPLSGLTLPVGTKRGEVILFNNNRPFSLSAGHENFFGTLIGAYTLTSKAVTSRIRAQLVINGVVFIKEFNRVGFRYPANISKMLPENVPSDFAGFLTPITDETVGRFAREIFGTNKVDPMSWPAEYQPGHRKFAGEEEVDLELPSDDDDDEEVVELPEEETPAVPDKRELLKAERVAEEAKRKKAIEAAKAKPKPKVVPKAHLDEAVVEKEAKVAVKKAATAAEKKRKAAEAEKGKEEEDDEPEEEEEKPVVKGKRKVEKKDEEEEEKPAVVKGKRKVEPEPEPEEEEKPAIKGKPKASVVRKQKADAAKAAAAAAENEDEDEEEGVTAPPAKKAAPTKKVAPKKKAAPVEKKDYGTPLAISEEELKSMEEELHVPALLRAREGFFAENGAELPEAMECLFTNAKGTGPHRLKLGTNENSLATVDAKLGDHDALLSFFDFFEKLGLTSEQEDELRNFVVELCETERKSAQTPNAASGKEARVMRVYGRSLKNGTSTIQCVEAAETPEVLVQLMQAADAYVQQLNAEVEVPNFNQIIAYGLNRKADVVKALKRTDVTTGT
jgi:hypothetical protein